MEVSNSETQQVERWLLGNSCQGWFAESSLYFPQMRTRLVMVNYLVNILNLVPLNLNEALPGWFCV